MKQYSQVASSATNFEPSVNAVATRRKYRNRKFYYSFRPEATFDIRKHLPNFETVAEVSQRSAKLCRSLDSDRTIHAPQCRKLARAIRRCRRRKRCGLIPCPKCRRRYRLWNTAEMLRVLEGIKPLWFVTLVPPDLRYPHGKLKDFDPKNLTERVKRQLQRAALRVIAIGSVDFSFEVDGRVKVKRRRRSAWQPHLHMIVSGCTRKELRAALGQHYLPTKTVRRPLVIKSVADTTSDRMKTSSYCTKPFFQENILYVSNGKRRKRSVALKKPQLHEIALFTASQPYSDLQLRIGVRQYGSELKLFSTKNGVKA